MSELMDKLIAVTNQLLDLGKRNRLLNYTDSGLKTLKILNKNSDEIFRAIKGQKDVSVMNVDSYLNQYHNENYPNDTQDDPLKYDDEKVYTICRKYLEKNQLMCHKINNPLVKPLKSLIKDNSFSLVEKGMNSLYISFGFIHYKEDNENYTAPLLLIPIELEKVLDDYYIRQYEDDILLNPTFNYYCSQMYNIELPKYDDEALQTYFSKVVQVLPLGVEFEDSMAIGIYSFYKMSMYQDIMNNKEKVLANINIKTLLGDTNAKKKYSKEDLDIYPVVNCDSSQLGAIQMAANGKSFCLQGPPGSGKSQTITNIIATLLGHGKKVLFVSEKIAALSVVYENLRRVHLSDFAIELHSNKANKKEFIRNLYDTASLPHYDINLKTNLLDQKYQILSSKLSEYERTLHQNISNLGCSLLDLYSMNEEYDVKPLDFNLDIDAYNLDDVKLTSSILDRYYHVSKISGYDYRTSPFYNLNEMSDEYILYNFSSDLENTLLIFDECYSLEEILVNYPTLQITNINDAIKKMEYLDLLAHLKTFNENYLNPKTRNRILDLIKRYTSIKKLLQSNILKIYNRDIIKTDINDLINRFNKALNNGKKLFNKELKEIKEEILKYRTDDKVTNETILKELQELSTYKTNLFLLNEQKVPLEKLVGKFNDTTLINISNDLNRIKDIPDLKITIDEYNSLKQEFLIKGLSISKIKPNIESLKKISLLFDRKYFDFYGANLVDSYNYLINISNNKDKAFNYKEMTKVIKNIKKTGAIDFLNKYLDLNLDLSLIARCFKKTFIVEKINDCLKDSSLLSDFDCYKEDGVVRDFRKLDSDILKINRDIIISEQSKHRPNETVMEGSEFKILTREYAKKRRQMPIRSLLDEIFDLALDIKPVFLMSPLSVSTYLASKLDIFDCVVFDEASQIFASDALGAIYRAKQCIIIGDTKQMPPTNFFHATVDDGEGEDLEYDLESVLDKAQEMFETTSLKWHYRSRSEELITFSNKAFYDFKLITIPQAKTHSVGFGIDYYYVENGIYQQSTRTNPIEAEYVADMVFEHYKHSKESLGVVAFSNVQADLIQSVIDKRLKKNPEMYDLLYKDNVEEPFFVKNLETVQGDERDRIIFSICYGFNEDKKFYQRFGPLNTLGGERRLNVAVTRAKVNVSIVASIHGTDVKESESKGVTLLRQYLMFAENVVTEKNYSDTSDTIVKEIKKYIESLGYEVFTNYGSSSFKIDLAVKKDNEFIYAFMMDGKSSYDANITDKYRLEKLLLERLGWKYYKIYTTSWIKDKDEEKSRIKDALEGNNPEDSTQEDDEEEYDNFLRIDRSIDNIDMGFVNYMSIDVERLKLYLEKYGIEYVVNEVIRSEAPININYLNQRIAEVYDLKRASDKIINLVNSSLPKNIHKVNDFILTNEKISGFTLRINSDRKIDEIYVDELMDGLYKIISRNNGIKKDGAYKSLIQILEISSLSQIARSNLDTALGHLINEGKVTIDQNECLRKK